MGYNQDFLANLRLKSIFGADQGDPGMIQDFSGDFQPEVTDMPELSGPAGGYAPSGIDAYRPQTEATDRFNQLVANRPEYEGPSALRSIAAGLSAFGRGGHEAGMQVLNEPNVRRQTEWKEQLGPAQQAANLERQENVNARTLAYQTEQTKLAQQRIDAKAKQDEAMNKIRDRNAATREVLAKNPNLVAIPQEGGTVKYMDTKTKEIFDTGLQSGELDDVTKFATQQKNALERIEAQAEAARKTAAEKEAAKAAKTPNNEQLIKDRTQETINAIDTLLDKNGKLTSLAQSAVGPSRLLPTHLIPGTQGRAGDVAINNLKSQLVINLIGEMKAQSKTGATGFGAMNLKELNVLETAANKLDTSLDEESFAIELKRIRDKLYKVLQPATGMVPTEAKTDSTVVKPGAVVKPSNIPPNHNAADLIKKYGG